MNTYEQNEFEGNPNNLVDSNKIPDMGCSTCRQQIAQETFDMTASGSGYLPQIEPVDYNTPTIEELCYGHYPQNVNPQISNPVNAIDQLYGRRLQERENMNVKDSIIQYYADIERNIIDKINILIPKVVTINGCKIYFNVPRNMVNANFEIYMYTIVNGKRTSQTAIFGSRTLDTTEDINYSEEDIEYTKKIELDCKTFNTEHWFMNADYFLVELLITIKCSPCCLKSLFVNKSKDASGMELYKLGNMIFITSILIENSNEKSKDTLIGKMTNQIVNASICDFKTNCGIYEPPNIGGPGKAI